MISSQIVCFVIQYFFKSSFDKYLNSIENLHVY